MLPPELLRVLEHSFGLLVDQNACEALLGAYGSVRDSGFAPFVCLVRHKGAVDVMRPHRVVVKRYPAVAVSKVEYQLTMMEQLSRFLHCVPCPMRIADGSVFLGSGPSEDFVWSVTPFIEGGVAVARGCATIAQWEALGALAAKIQNVCWTHPPDLSHLSYVHRYKTRMEVLCELQSLSNTSFGRTLSTPETAWFWTGMDLCKEALRKAYILIPESVMIHNDLGFSNVLFDSADGIVIQILIDFDLTQQDIPIAEFNSLVWTLPGHLPLYFDLDKYNALKSSYLLELTPPQSFARCKAELSGFIDEIVRSRLYEEVGRHWLRLYPQSILDSPDFQTQTLQREELLRSFCKHFQVQKFSRSQ